MAFKEEYIQLSGLQHFSFCRRHIPKFKPTKGGNVCSLRELCLPKRAKKRSGT